MTSEITRAPHRPARSGGRRSSRSCPTPSRRAGRSAPSFATAIGRARWSCWTGQPSSTSGRKAAFTFPAERRRDRPGRAGRRAGRDGIDRCSAAATVCEGEGALEVIVARDDADRERLWADAPAGLAVAARGARLQAVGGHRGAARLDRRDAARVDGDRRATRPADGHLRPRGRRQPARQRPHRREPPRAVGGRAHRRTRWGTSSARPSTWAAPCPASTASASPRLATWPGSNPPR